MLNVERDLDPKNADWQWGFKFTGMYGTDSRVTHFYGEFDRVTKQPLPMGHRRGWTGRRMFRSPSAAAPT